MSKLPKYFWADTVYSAAYVLKRTLIRPILKKTPYELYKGRKPSVSHLRVFGCKCFVLNNGKENLGKFDAKSDEGVHIGYALNGHAYRVFNKRLLMVEESMHVVFDEADHSISKTAVDDLDCNEFKSVLNQNESIHFDTANTHAMQEPTVSAGLPKRIENPMRPNP